MDMNVDAGLPTAPGVLLDMKPYWLTCFFYFYVLPFLFQFGMEPLDFVRFPKILVIQTAAARWMWVFFSRKSANHLLYTFANFVVFYHLMRGNCIINHIKEDWVSEKLFCLWSPVQQWKHLFKEKQELKIVFHWHPVYCTIQSSTMWSTVD